MDAILSQAVPFLVNIAMITAVMLALLVMMMGVGWASGKVIRKFLGLGGK